MAKLHRINIKEHPSYITTKTENNYPYFEDAENAKIILSTIYFCRQRDWIYLLSFVIMPDHLHLIFIPRDTKTSSQIMHSIKSFSGSQINKRMSRNGSLWQRSFWEYKIPDRQTLLQKVNYLNENPLRRRLCESIDDYPYSSANPKYETDLELFL